MNNYCSSCVHYITITDYVDEYAKCSIGNNTGAVDCGMECEDYKSINVDMYECQWCNKL